ncbi:uncharacterized protein EV420DRAFT_1312172 [Desarmillaria tabescens]|uniref:F-box domain-containing protein n=1 Tax=Armillaria tabescens TaxID=1929756 RepID=A0AA39JZ13_ARMTA|nr:uncharacterized protein EV420DRAFT_1312172 [Desarmillaria tabescens]KAK0451257.1 hypothetical protein EV420DRAFT_1312172 [Desarmillaria tabescens]
MPPYITLCDNCGHSLDTHVSSLHFDTDAYLCCGAQISESEADICSSTISSWQTKLAKCDVEILQLKTALEKLEDVRQSLADRIQRSRTLLAPIRTIPRDILQIIFECACLSISYNPFTECGEMPLIFATPNYLSSVCAYWHDICVSLSQLWTSTFIHAGHDTSPSYFNDLLARREKWSGKPLLNLQVSSATHNILQEARGNNIFDSLFHLHNSMDQLYLHRISIDFNNSTLAQAFHATPGLELPELEYLDLSGHSLSPSYCPHGQLINLFSRTPKLHTLKLALRGLRRTPFRLQRNQIVDIHLADYMHYLSFPDGFPNTTTATLQRCRMAFRDIINTPLRKLILHDSAIEWSSQFSPGDSPRGMKIPQLISLELIESEPLDPNGYTLILENIPDLTHSPDFTELILTTFYITCTALLSLLRTVPSLRRLSIVERTNTELITPKFIEELDTPGVLQYMEHLQLVWSGDVDEGAVMDVIERRATVLESVVIGIRHGGELEANTLSRVNGLRKRGMKISLW